MKTNLYKRPVAFIAAAMFCALLLAACGGSDEPSDEHPMVGMLQSTQSMTAVYNDLADAIAGIRDDDTADTAAARLQSDILPRARMAGAGMVEALVAISQYSEAELDLWSSPFSEEELVQIDDRHTAALYRMDDAFESLMMRPQFITESLQAALNDLGQAMMDMERQIDEATLMLVRD